MSNKKRLKEWLLTTYLFQPQKKKLRRFFSGSTASVIFLTAIWALYALYFDVGPTHMLYEPFMAVSFVYLLASPLLFYTLYRDSELKKIERTALIFFMLASAYSLLMAVLQLLFSIDQ